MTHRAVDDVWDDIVATLELGSGLRFVLVEAESPKERTKLRQRLQRYLEKQGKSLRSPAPGQDELDWLSQEQTQPGTGEPPDETRWLLLPRRGNERFFLHRLNEGRDNLRRNLSGVVFLLSGVSGFLQRLGNDAPDLWSVRELAVELKSPVDSPKSSVATPAKKVSEAAAAGAAYDVYLSYSHYDASFARALHERLEKDGLRVLAANADLEPAIYRLHLMAPTGHYLCLLSPSYVSSFLAVSELQWIRIYKPSVYPSRFIPIMVRAAVMPPELRQLAYLDFRTDKQFEANYPRLLQILKSPSC